MKIVLISTADIQGGAPRAAYRLHQGLQRIGVDSKMLAQYKYSNDKTVIAPTTRFGQSIARTRIAVDRLPEKLYPRRQKAGLSPQWLPDQTVPKITQLNPDIINLHWIGEAFLQVETIAKFKQPLVWTLHDMWTFTGGCHYSGECDRYTANCGACPQLGSNQDWDLSRWVWQRKAKAWRNVNLTVVALSSWLANCARASSLFKDLRIELIPNGIDTTVYRPINQQIARELLNLPQHKALVLFGALKATSNPRKGFHRLQAALQDLSQSEWQDRLDLVIFGASEADNPMDVGFPTHYLGTLNDELMLALTYSAADVFVLPSTQDNLPNTVMEAIACGTPCVAFNLGGLPDMIEHEQNGYLAQPDKVEDLAQGIVWVLENQERHQKLSHCAREKAEQEFTMELQANRYLSLFTELLEKGDYPKH
ncbi:glycosyltransferase family 4 protein [Coleofasciculus sp. E2-BRE-01]|uniref:glycosyltransferase family 4 protein n=1 Tax=Coleofasciculus sp. E2-BRE-01 TaxID=3069524 RepID=UPI0032F167CE